MIPEDYSVYAHALTHHYGKRRVLDHVDLSLRPGEFFGFLGQNGAGKSTAIRALCGLLQPTEGEIRVAGVDVRRDSTAVREHIGVLSEDIMLYDRLTGAEFLEFVGQMHGLSHAESRRRAVDLQERLDLIESAHQPIGMYSLGMQKKTAFAAALIHAPRVLFLDEPFNGVDAASTRSLCALLQFLCKEQGVTVFFTSHVLEMAERLCDRIAILTHGQIGYEDTIGGLKRLATQQGTTLEETYLHLIGANTDVKGALEWYDRS